MHPQKLLLIFLPVVSDSVPVALNRILAGECMGEVRVQMLLLLFRLPGQMPAPSEPGNFPMCPRNSPRGPGRALSGRSGMGIFSVKSQIV